MKRKTLLLIFIPLTAAILSVITFGSGVFKNIERKNGKIPVSVTAEKADSADLSAVRETVIAADKYYKYYSINGKGPTCVKYNIYDRSGNTVFSETTDRPVKITRNGDNVIDIAKGMGTGITAHKFYNTEENAFSETFYGVISSSDRLVAFIDVDREKPLENRTLIVQDIFDGRLFYKSFNLDFSAVDTPVTEAHFSEDGRKLTVTYMSGNAGLEKTEVLRCR